MYTHLHISHTDTYRESIGKCELIGLNTYFHHMVKQAQCNIKNPISIIGFVGGTDRLPLSYH